MAEMKQTLGGNERPLWTKSGLSKSMRDHERVGSSGSGGEAILRDPDKSEGENMTDEEILTFITKRISDVREQHERTLKDPSEKRFLKMFLEDWLIPDIAYLRHVNRLPEEFKDFDPTKEFAIPE